MCFCEISKIIYKFPTLRFKENAQIELFVGMQEGCSILSKVLSLLRILPSTQNNLLKINKKKLAFNSLRHKLYCH